MIPKTSHSILIILALLILSVATYSNSLHNEFMMDDKPVLFAQNITPDLKHIWSVFDYTNKPFVFYRPVSHFLRSLLVASVPRNPFYYHLFNLLLFGIHISLVFLLLKKLLNKIFLPFLICVLYCVHPINSTQINYITAHEILFFGLSLDLSMLFFLNYLDRKRNSWLILSVLCFALSMLIQEITIVFALIPFLISFQYKKGLSFSTSFKMCRLYFIIAAIYLALRLLFITHTHEIISRMLTYAHTSHLNIFIYLNTILKLLWWYFKQLIFPSEIVLMKNMPPQEMGTGPNLIIGLLVTLGLFLIYRRRWKENRFLFGLLWLAVGFIPLLGISFIYPYGGFILEPHWFFFSSIGFFLLIGLCVDRLFQFFKNPINKLTLSLLILIQVFLWFSTTRTYNQIWRTQKSYCLYWLSLSPDFYFPNLWLANSFYVENNMEQAKYYYQKALVEGSIDWFVYKKLGNIELRLNHFNEAEQYYAKALKLNP